MTNFDNFIFDLYLTFVICHFYQLLKPFFITANFLN